MATKTFSGKVSAQVAVGETVTITVTKPDGTKDTLTAVTVQDGSFQTTADYPAGSYSAVFHVDADAEYTSAEDSVSFVVDLTTRTISGAVS